ncbi:histidine phosphatase family protein [Psychromonas sp. SP041]|uniref:histidine phosphatase family protein n=1 Tax=Psychromonas sp. SP041 TaxID=1365007 RepID=UPI0004001156|nr:histidine phosphatase family protein [Psychromonas sp. SP041]
MQITIIRHGKPDPISEHPMTATEFTYWITFYDQSKVSLNTSPLPSSVTHANNCNAIICSRLQRSIDSASILNAGKIVLCDDLFIEAGLPSASWHTFKMTPKFWAICFRVLWLLGYSHHSESIKEVKARAALATDKLIELATQHHKVLFVGHGIFNRFLVKELIRRGWSGAKSPQSEYWAGDLYKKS